MRSRCLLKIKVKVFVSVKSLGAFWIKMRANQLSFNTDISFGERGIIHQFMSGIYELDPETVGKLER